MGKAHSLRTLQSRELRPPLPRHRHTSRTSPRVQVVFHSLASSGSGWPQVYGKVDERGKIVEIERKSEGGLFAALDNHLKTARIKFRVRHTPWTSQGVPYARHCTAALTPGQAAGLLLLPAGGV